MGIVARPEERRMEIEEFCRTILLSCADMQRRKDGGDELSRRQRRAVKTNDEVRDRLICVTSGVSYLGAAIVKQLLLRGYDVRLILDNEEDVEKVREMELSGEMMGHNDNNNNILEAVTAKLSDAQSVSESINGCHAVFHTAAFIDPAGVSGYSKTMAEVEAKVSENVIKACGISPSVRKCVLTSSLLACIWRSETSGDQFSAVIDHNSWSDESRCVNKKLWYALGKLMAEKVAWKIAREEGLKMASICPALVTGPEFYGRNPTSTIAYLKGAQEMYANGLLATVNVNRLAEAHIRVFEAMNNKSVCGRYICFDQTIGNQDEVEKLTVQTEMSVNMIEAGNACRDNSTRFKLSNANLLQLTSRTPRCMDEC